MFGFRCMCAGGTPVMAGKCLVLSLLNTVVEKVLMRNCFSLGMFSGVGENGMLVGLVGVVVFVGLSEFDTASTEVAVIG